MGILDRFEQRVDRTVNGALRRHSNLKSNPLSSEQLSNVNSTNVPRSCRVDVPSCPTSSRCHFKRRLRSPCRLRRDTAERARWSRT